MLDSVLNELAKYSNLGRSVLKGDSKSHAGHYDSLAIVDCVLR